MSSRNPTDWMWAQACELIDEAERMHRRFFRLAASGRSHVTWEPPVDVFEDEFEIVVLVALPGVPAHRIQVTTESGELVVRAERALPFAGSRQRGAQARDSLWLRSSVASGCPTRGSMSGRAKLLDGCLLLRLRKLTRGVDA